MRPLGTPAPDFALPGAVGEEAIRLGTFAGKRALLVMFLYPHCPCLQHVRHEVSVSATHWRTVQLSTVSISACRSSRHASNGEGRRRPKKRARRPKAG